MPPFSGSGWSDEHVAWIGFLLFFYFYGGLGSNVHLDSNLWLWSGGGSSSSSSTSG